MICCITSLVSQVRGQVTTTGVQRSVRSQAVGHSHAPCLAKPWSKQRNWKFFGEANLVKRFFWSELVCDSIFTDFLLKSAWIGTSLQGLPEGWIMQNAGGAVAKNMWAPAEVRSSKLFKYQHDHIQTLGYNVKVSQGSPMPTEPQTTSRFFRLVERMEASQAPSSGSAGCSIQSF